MPDPDDPGACINPGDVLTAGLCVSAGPCNALSPCDEGYECAGPPDVEEPDFDDKTCVCDEPTLCGVGCSEDADCPSQAPNCDQLWHVCREEPDCLSDLMCDEGVCHIKSCEETQGSKIVGDSCSQSSQCESHVCGFGLCLDACLFTSECGVGQNCKSVDFDRWGCVSVQASGCGACDGNESCSGSCEDACRVSSDCGASEVCLHNGEDYWCGPGSDCTADEFDYYAACVVHQTCWSSLDCPVGYGCWDQVELELGQQPGPVLGSGYCARPK